MAIGHAFPEYLFIYLQDWMSVMAFSGRMHIWPVRRLVILRVGGDRETDALWEVCSSAPLVFGHLDFQWG